MKPEEINEINRMKREQQTEKKYKYCPRCKQDYYVACYRSKCPTCKNELQFSSQNAPLKNTPKCPTCQSTNIKKISDFKKVTHGLAFGLFSKTAKSQFQCNNCGYKW